MGHYQFVFPYDKIAKGSTIVLYGAGNVAKSFISQIRETDYCKINYIVDRNYNELVNINGIEIYSPETLERQNDYDKVVIATFQYVAQVLTFLTRINISHDKIVVPDFYDLSFAANGEDRIIMMIFFLLGMNKFSYIDVGANNPYLNSDTALLYLHGCRGINVEANPIHCEALKIARPEDITINVAVGVQYEKLQYYMFEDEHDGANTLVKSWADKWINNTNTQPVEIRDMSVIPLQEVINEYANSIWPDYLKIDIEGFDYDVLNSLDFTKNAPFVIMAEIVTDSEVVKLNNMLDKKGFRMCLRLLHQAIYVRKDVLNQVAQISWVKEISR